jgi:pyruvate/2-oxoglutarate/acetoin dehydrogenase E1 component
VAEPARTEFRLTGPGRNTGPLLIVDEDYPRCGIASKIAAAVSTEAFDFLDQPLECDSASRTRSAQPSSWIVKVALAFSTDLTNPLTAEMRAVRAANHWLAGGVC